jgi:hypothetical protein
VHVAVIEICGRIEPGGFFDPDLIADAYWSLHGEKFEDFQAEISYRPGSSFE